MVGRCVKNVLISYTSDFFSDQIIWKKCVLIAAVLVADVSVPPLGFLILMCKLFIQKNIQYLSMSTKHAGKAQITALLARTCCFMAMLAQVDIFLNDVRAYIYTGASHKNRIS